MAPRQPGAFDFLERSAFWTREKLLGNSDGRSQHHREKRKENRKRLAPREGRVARSARVAAAVTRSGSQDRGFSALNLTEEPSNVSWP